MEVCAGSQLNSTYCNYNYQGKVAELSSKQERLQDIAAKFHDFRPTMWMEYMLLISAVLRDS